MTENTAEPGQNDTYSLLLWNDLAAEEIWIAEESPDPIVASHECPPWCFEASEWALEHPGGEPFRHSAQTRNADRVCASSVVEVPTWRYPGERRVGAVSPAHLDVELEQWHAVGAPYVNLHHVLQGPERRIRTIALRIEEAAHLASVLAAAVNLAMIEHEVLS